MEKCSIISESLKPKKEEITKFNQKNEIKRKFHKNINRSNALINSIVFFITINIIVQIKSLLNKNRIINSKFSFIILRSDQLGTQNILSSYYQGQYPDKIYFNDSLEYESPTISINLTTTDLLIKLEFATNINNCRNMFRELNNIIEIDLSNFNSSLVTDTSYMFRSCSALTSINMDIFETSQLKNMAGLSSYCKNLLSVNLLNFDTSLVTNMNEFIRGCQSLTSINVYNFNTSLVTDVAAKFREK